MKANILQELVAKWRREVARYEASEASRNDECATCAELTFEECADELQAALDAQTGGWQPIESAPRDGRSLILLLTPSGFPQVAYSNTWWTAGFSVECKPTHWMPLPAGPVEGGK